MGWWVVVAPRIKVSVPCFPHILIVDLRLDPVHEEGDVLRGGQVGGLLVLGPVLPQVLELGAPGHGGATLSGTLKHVPAL